MVERFNATLKQLLKKLTQSQGAQWDKCLPYILWAYRGITQKTTGFSPYHLLFGRPMRMPLDQWSGIGRVKKREMSVVQRSTCNNLEGEYEVRKDQANKREIKEKEMQKVYHDRKSVVREFSVGDYVLVFRPIRKGKLENQWQGPLIITKKITEVTYLVDLGPSGKRYRTFHVNCMKQWTSPAPAVFLVHDPEEDPQKVIERNSHTACQPLITWT